MARFLLDTNMISFIVNSPGTAIHHRLLRAQANSYVATSSVTEAELRFGVALLPPEAKLHKTMTAFLDGIEIESWDSQCAQQYAQLAAVQYTKGNRMSMPDTMIAAHALAHDFTLITNDKAFARVRSLRVEDWTKGPQRS